MGRQKLIRREKIQDFKNVFDCPEDLKGRWSEHFGNDNPIVLELACGKADFSYGFAEMHPDKNIIAVDKKCDRIYVGAKKALENGLDNLAFCRCLIDNLYKYFDEAEVDEIWITFADPHPKKNKKNKRLTWTRFLKIYKKILKPDGYINHKTDAEGLHDWTAELLNELGIQYEELKDIYSNNPNPVLQIKTAYERKHLAAGRQIHYLRFQLNKLRT